MTIRAMSFILAASLLAAPLAAQETAAPHEEREAAFFWTMMSLSGLAFATGVGMYVAADYYEDEIDARAGQADFTADEKDEFNFKAQVYWTSAVICMGSSTAALLFGLKKRFDAESPLAVVNRPDGSTLFSYRYRF